MKAFSIVRLALAGAALTALAGTTVFAQSQPLLPSSPKLAFGGTISPAYDGWFDNADGSRTFMMGYYSRNWEDAVDVPIGLNNRFEPGEPDRGQPTHFRPNRNFGMFTVTVPKGVNEKLWWVLIVNGVTQRVPLSQTPDYNITPQHASEEWPGGKYNRPAILRFAETGPALQMPAATQANAVSRLAMVGVPMAVDFWVDDDARYASGSNAPINPKEPIVEMVVAKYRGVGKVRVSDGHHTLTVLEGGGFNVPYAAKGTTMVTFSEPGEYQLHVTANDLSGPGGGSSGCCWTTGLIKVSVKPGGAPPAVAR